ncbi:hypothetical protein BDA99DRAFT_569620 [Phascolomyces articulosus]|uniref:Uncharacterized protein n=1 Tax=Phascolomyces articulosus TaxID=60185 RepID=A0AAD5KII6_9FUNG|nr:hypothetical protein BDA99DRAFT_569620 [Phascolomyces articulosus]
MSRSNPQQKQHISSQYKVVIAYDFGTTYSGAAYAFTHTTPTEVFDIQNWPNKGGNFYPKVPTLSVYPRRNQGQLTQSSGRSTLSEWGHGAKKAMLKTHGAKENVLLSHFKLNLDKSLQRPPLENGLQPAQAVADYLRCLHEHTLQEVERSFAKNYLPDTFRYCLTVPAVWSDKAKNSMRQAAIQAGLITPSDPTDRLILVSEPEAAALYCEETMANQVELKDKDRIMICDAGGGTVDLIVFEVNFTEDPNNNEASSSSDTSRTRKRQLKEVTKGSGESCGSIFLDDRFRKLLKSKLGEQVMSNISPRELYNMMESFSDAIKPEFNGVDDHFLELPRSVKVESLPLSLREEDDENHLDQGVLKLTGQELKEHIFDPVVNKVLFLIDRQYQQIPDNRLNFLFLVGGFGSSKYLYQKIEKVFRGVKVKKIVCPADRAALAVVRGAAYYGVDPQVVVSRVARRTYGMNLTVPYDDKIDPPSKRVLRPDGSPQCTSRFIPFVKKNDELPVDHCSENQFFVNYSEGESYDVSSYATTNDTIPRYCDDPDVYRVAKFSVVTPNIPGIDKGDPIDVTVRMYFGTTEIRFEAEFSTGQKFDVYGDYDEGDDDTFPK